jgi:hypothetical protein
MTGTRLRISEEVGVDRAAEVVRCGIPLPTGSLSDPAAHSVVAADGRTVLPSQVLWSQRDSDGWVRWLALAFPVTLGALDSTMVTVRTGDPGERPATETPAGVVHQPGTVILTTGRVTASISLDPFSVTGPDLSVAGSRVIVVDESGTRHPAVADQVQIRHRGPLVAQVELTGRYGGDSATGWAFAARLTALTGASSVEVELGLVNVADEPESDAQEWSFEVDTGAVASGSCGVFGAGHTSTGPFVIRHRGQGHSRGLFTTAEVVGGSEWSDASDPAQHARWEWSELQARQAGNWVAARTGEGNSLTVSAHRFAENHPTDLAVTDQSITVRWWPADAGLLRLTQGAAKTRRVRLTRGTEPRAGMTLDSPLVPCLDAALETGAVPQYLPYLPHRYPHLESHIRDEMFGWYLYGQSLGFHDFGDSVQNIVAGPRTGYSANNEHDALLAVLLHYLRSGERAYFDSAQAYADHLCDIDLIHHSSVFGHEVGGLRAHGHGHVHYVEARTPDGPVRTSIDTGHLWTEGLILFGQVSGDERYLDAARRVGDCLIGLTDIGWTRPEPGPRNSGWPLTALASLTRATGDQRYLDAARLTAKAAVAAQRDDGRWLMRLGLVDDYCAWQNAVMLIGLARLLQIEESAEVRAAFRAGSRALLDLGRNPDGTFVYLQRFEYRWASRPALVREALALAFDDTGDERFIRAGLVGGARWYRPRGSAPAVSNDVAEWRGHLTFLARAHATGLLEDLPDA